MGSEVFLVGKTNLVALVQECCENQGRWCVFFKIVRSVYLLNSFLRRIAYLNLYMVEVDNNMSFVSIFFYQKLTRSAYLEFLHLVTLFLKY